LKGIDIENYLIAGGLSQSNIHAIRKRLIEQAGKSV